MKRILIGILIILLLFALPLIVWRVYLAHVVNRQLAQIRAAGLPTNGEELNQWYINVPDNENAALVLMKAFELRRHFAGSRSNLIHDFKPPKRGERLSSQEVELLDEYVAMNAAMLAKADEALALPASRYPVDFTLLMYTPLPHLAWLKELAELHQYSAFLAMESGHLENASSNIVIMLALARTLDNEPVTVSQFVRLGIFNMAVATLEHRANAGAFTTDELTSLTTAFEHAGTTNLAVRTLIGERALIVPLFRLPNTALAVLRPETDEADANKASPLPCHGPAILRLIGYYELDLGTFLYAMEKGIELASHPPPENLALGGCFAHAGQASWKRHRTISGMVFSSYAGIDSRENEGIARHRMVMIALKVEQFRNQSGRLPNELEDLGSDMFSDLSTDPFTGAELQYRRTQSGYIVYSTGRDQNDDGGLEKSDKKESSDGKSYDLTFIVER